VYITENGLSCNDKVYLDGKVHDADRIDFLHRYLLVIQRPRVMA
jgi:beta-glucosidase